MAIVETDLVFLASERLDDTPAGGGRMTGTVIPDGQENNLFPDIAPTDRVFGRVRMRKVFAANRSDSVDLFLGAHAVLTHKPADPDVDITLFSTGSWTDTRSEAREYVERYLTRGGYWPGHLYGNHLTGQRAVQIYQLPGVELPAAGQTYVLIQDEGEVNEQEQYIRLTAVEAVTREFVDQQGSFTRVVVTATLSDPLRADFIGTDPTRYTTSETRTRLRETLASAAAHYYGGRPLTVPAEAGDRSLLVDSLYAQLVPSTQTETPLADLDAVGRAAPLTVCGAALTLTTSAPLGPSARLYLLAGIEPGSLTLVSGAITLTDDAQGHLKSGDIVVGSVDYTEGTLIGVTGGPSYPDSKTLTWTPAATPSAVSHTAGITVTSATRALNYVLTLAPIPKPFTLRVDYRAGGRWYRLQDRGDGGLVGVSSAHGAGRLNFSTGTAMITLGALPDADSMIIFVWAVVAEVWNRSREAFDPPKYLWTLSHPNIVPNSLAMAWLSSGDPQAASDDGAGNLTGDATGTIDYATGELVWVPALLPQQGTEVSASYDYGAPKSAAFAEPALEPDGTLALTLPDTGLVAGSVRVDWNLTVTNWQYPPNISYYLQVFPAYQATKTARDDGSGALVISGGANGTINYGAGTLAFDPEVATMANKAQYGIHEVYGRYRVVLEGYSYAPVSANLPNTDGLVTVYYRIAGSNSDTETLTVTATTVDVTKGYTEAIVPGSLRFTLGVWTYVDRAGSLYYNVDPATGSGTLGGTIDYASGRATLSVWPTAVVPNPALHTLLTRLNTPITDETVFRVAVAPVRPGSFSIRATPVESGGAAISITDDGGAVYAAGEADGVINYETGVVQVRWGEWVNDGDLTPEEKEEIWYTAEAVVERNGVDQIFRPRPVYADTITYNAVGYSYLPLSAELLGLDPVRLPSDGRVPVLQVGDMALVQHHTVHTVSTPPAGGTVDTELTGVARARVYDSLGAAVPPSRYSLDQSTGIVTWANPLDLSGYTGPYTVEATIEDAALITATDISGQLTLNRVLTHAYPEGALVSSAYVFGDLFAQASTPFAQQAWTSVWSDARIGSPLLAQYNSLLYPIQLNNASSWRERWALLFTSATSFRVIGETLGDITDQLGGDGFHDIDHDLAPVNPITSTPYFTLSWQGWGSGWVAGNVLRFNLLPPANFPLWIAQTVQPSAPTEGQDQFRLLLRGGIDA